MGLVAHLCVGAGCAFGMWGCYEIVAIKDRSYKLDENEEIKKLMDNIYKEKVLN